MVFPRGASRQLILLALLLGLASPAAARTYKTGAKPVVSACGTNPINGGTESAGYVIFGSGTVTSCVLTFTPAWRSVPVCIIGHNQLGVSLIHTATTTTLTVIAQVSVPGAGVVYHCVGIK